MIHMGGVRPPCSLIFELDVRRACVLLQAKTSKKWGDLRGCNADHQCPCPVPGRTGSVFCSIIIHI